MAVYRKAPDIVGPACDAAAKRIGDLLAEEGTKIIKSCFYQMLADYVKEKDAAEHERRQAKLKKLIERRAKRERLRAKKAKRRAHA
jgi:hypothetical protein